MFRVIASNGVATTYPNITHITSPKTMKERGIVVVAWLEGEPDLWLVKKGHFDSLVAYYEAEWRGQRITYNVLRQVTR